MISSGPPFLNKQSPLANTAKLAYNPWLGTRREYDQTRAEHHYRHHLKLQRGTRPENPRSLNGTAMTPKASEDEYGEQYAE